jgi:shikimate dehydrogenase
MTNNEMNLGLVGFPLGHSFSKILQEEALRFTGLSGRYDLWEIPVTPAGDQALKLRLDSVRKNQTKGINVTIPHKERVIPYLDSLTPIASAIGAVNTIYWDADQNQLCGHNTDAPAFMTEVYPLIHSQNSKQALVLGAGGAARAVICQLLEINWRVTIASRNIVQAEEIIRHFVDFDL